MQTTVNLPGPVLGVGDEVPLSQMQADELQRLWSQLLRNRNYLDVIKLIEGTLVPETFSEERIREVHHELFARGLDPLRT